MTNRFRTITALGAVAALTLTGCASGSDDAGTTADEIVIEHAFGQAEIPADAERVVTIGWGSTDAVLALGVMPVGIGYQSYGGDENGVVPWVADAIDGLGGEAPTVLPDSEEVPIEAIAELEPDVILATYSGIDESDWELLDAIAPTVAFPEAAWSTPWRDVITTAGTALQLEDEADEIIAGIEDELAATAAEHPEFAGLTIAAAADFGGKFYGYTPADPRVELLLELGFENPESVAALDPGAGAFSYELSNEQLDTLTSDLLLLYWDDQATADAWLAGSAGQTMPQVTENRVANLVGTELVAAVSPPTALSATWGLDELVSALSAAAQG